MKKFILLYIASIILFGVIYRIHWECNPNSFIFHEQYNLNPFSSDSKIRSHKISLDYFQQISDSLKKVDQIETTELLNISRQIDLLRSLKETVYNLYEESRQKEIERWEKQHTDSTLIVKSQLLDEELKKREPTTDAEFSLLKLKKAEIDFAIAKSRLESTNYILLHYAKWGNKGLLRNFLYLDSLYSDLSFNKKTKLELQNIQTKLSIENLRYHALEELTERICLIDFILYSTSNATTISFGDITPNDIVAKVLLVFQGLCSTLFIGFFVDKIINTSKSKSK